MIGQSQLFSSGKDDWGTPNWLFNLLHDRFKFTIDLAASKENAKLPRFFTEQDDSLKQSWKYERGFDNPPYTLAPKFIRKGWEESEYNGAFSAHLVPARCSNAEWHDYVLNDKAQELIYIRGRVVFEGAKLGAPFPSVVIVYDPYRRGEKMVTSTIDARFYQARIREDDRAASIRQTPLLLQDVLDRRSPCPEAEI